MERIITVILIVIILVLLLICNFPLALVEGNSMYPTYKDGSVLLATRLFNIEHLKVGDVCVYQRGENLVIKRITRINPTGDSYSFYFEGDNPTDSYDSRLYDMLKKKES